MAKVILQKQDLTYLQWSKIRDCLDPRLMDAIWNMIWRRYKEYEDLCSQK